MLALVSLFKECAGAAHDEPTQEHLQLWLSDRRDTLLQGLVSQFHDV